MGFSSRRASARAASPARTVALITGASSGIGEAIAYALARDGYDLCLVARRGDVLAEVARKAKAIGARVDVVALDLQAIDAGTALMAATDRMGLRIDLLVNNAGYGSAGRFLDLSRDDQIGAIDLNVRALTDLTHRYLGRMQAGGFGEGVINVASTAAFQPGPHMAIYYATKAFVLSFTEALNQELKLTGHRAMALCPGPVWTGFQRRANFDDTMLLTRVMAPRTPEFVAQAAVKAFRRGKPVVIPGLIERIGARSVAFMPRSWLLSIVAHIQKKQTGAGPASAARPGQQRAGSAPEG